MQRSTMTFSMHWISMGIENPIVYFESWELQTFGYWTINHPLVLLHNGNINGGAPPPNAE